MISQVKIDKGNSNRRNTLSEEVDMEIRTFVFLDLETTGLIPGNVMPKITEIALVAISRESVCYSNKDFLPRVLHKLVLPVNPQKIIPPNVEDMTKLYNEDVQVLQPFESDIYELITHFLRRLTPPICFAAHNGNRFDYPIFLGELERIEKMLNNDILCVDTWKMFQDFFKNRNLELKVIEDMLNDGYNDSLSMVDVNMVTEEPKITATTSTAQTTLLYDDVKITKKVEEYSNYVDVQLSKNPMQESNEKTPKTQIIKMENAFVQRPFKRSNPKKRLNFDRERPRSLKLVDIYEYMFQSDFSYSHTAEGDCLAMISCVIKVADFFLDWSKNNAFPLSCCKKT